MDDLISRAAAIRAALRWYVNPDGGVFNAIKANIRSNLEQVPAVDAVPVVHASWIDYKDDHQCSACKEHRTERSLLDAICDSPTIDAIPMDWMDTQIHGYASRLASTELKALLIVKRLWEKEQEAR